MDYLFPKVHTPAAHLRLLCWFPEEAGKSCMTDGADLRRAAQQTKMLKLEKGEDGADIYFGGAFRVGRAPFYVGPVRAVSPSPAGKLIMRICDTSPLGRLHPLLNTVAQTWDQSWDDDHYTSRCAASSVPSWRPQ